MSSSAAVAHYDIPLFDLAPGHVPGLSTSGVSKDLANLTREVVGQSIPRPRGALAGHNTGTPVEELLRVRLGDAFPGRIWRQHDVLNAVLSNSPEAVSATRRKRLFGRESTQDLLCSGRSLRKWSLASPFGESQSDTADFILFDGELCALEPGRYDLLDAKSVNLEHTSQPPNIISAAKLFRAMVHSVAEGAVACDIIYLAIGYQPTKSTLDCTDARAISLFKIDQLPYINWTAGSQIQFDPFEVDQEFRGSPLQWADRFVDYYNDKHALKISRDRDRLREDRQRVKMARSGE
jgi:hypothetical protein